MSNPMNHEARGGTGGDAPISAEEIARVAGVSAALDRLAAAERCAALPALEDRLFAASRRVLVPVARDIAPIEASADAVAGREQLAAPDQLEERVFELSREAVASGRFTDRSQIAGDEPREPALRIVHAEVRARVTVRPWWNSPALRVAAAIAIMATVAAIVISRSGPGAPTNIAANPSIGASVDEIAASISTEMDAVFATMESDGLGSGSDTVLSESDVDTSWVDEMFTRESL